MFRAFAQTLFKGRRDSKFQNLESFAHGYPAFLEAVHSFAPDVLPKNVGSALFQSLSSAIVNADHDVLILMIDCLRYYRDPDLGSGAGPFWNALIADCRNITASRIARKQIRTLWGVTPIANLNCCVAADRNLGFESHSLVFNSYYISSDFDIVLSSIQDRIVVDRPEDTYLFRWLVFIWALVNYDIFHLFNDRGIIEPAGGYGSPRFGIALREMEIYREAPKRLYTFAYGADHRLRNKTLAMGKWSFCSECPDPGKFCVCDDEGGALMLETIRQHATSMVAHGLAMQIIPGAVNIPYLCVDVKEIRRQKSPLPRRSGR